MSEIKIKEMKELVNPALAPAGDNLETFYPKTHEKAVVDDDGNTLDSKIESIIEDVDEAIADGIQDMNSIKSQTLSEAGAILNGGAVRADVAQSLTDAQKAQALANVGISGIDDEPTAGSDNLVKSGGVQNELALGAVYDVSAKNPTAGPNNDGKWESISALLSDNNLNTLIPTAVRKGGMSIKFVQSSYNKYVQYRLMADEWSIDIYDWALMEGDIIKPDAEWVEVHTDRANKILYGVKDDGKFYFGDDCPPQIKEYVDTEITEHETDVKILFFGNSLTEDAVQYVPWMLKKIAPELNFKIVNWYKAGATLATQLDILNGNGTPDRVSLSTNETPKWVEAKEQWPSIINDIQHITIQEHTASVSSFDSTSYNGVIEKLKTLCGKDVKFHHLLQKTITGDIDAAQYAEDYAVEAWSKMPISSIVNPGTAFDYAYKDVTLNAVITSDSTYTDTTHAEEGLPCYVEALLVTQWIFEQIGKQFSIQVDDLILDATEYATIGARGTNVGTNGPIFGSSDSQRRAQEIAQIAFNKTHDLETKLISEKVDKETGKSLISVDVAESLKYEFNSDYINVETDVNNRVLGGRKIDGTLFNNTPYENVLSRIDYLPSNDWVDLVTDNKGKIIEGVTQDGKKHVSDFDDSTKIYISKLSSIYIAELNEDFVSPIPVTITGAKGSENAKYEFVLNLDEEAFNIRFKFRITENLLNQNKSAVIAKLGNSTVVKAFVEQLAQYTTTATYDGQTKTNYWPCLNGGIKFLNNNIYKHRNNIGNIAFYVKYTGEDSASIENTGENMVIKIGSNTNTFSYTTYPTVSELYEAVKALQDISVGYRELNNRNCAELAIFPECNLRPTMYTGITGQSGAPIVEYVDAAEFMIPYAVDETWHNVEIVKINKVIYVTCDGDYTTIVASELNNIVLTLGGECGVLFKDLTICPSSVNDAEYVDGTIISSYNPYLIIYEGHGIDKTPSVEASTIDNMNTTIDRLEYVFSLLKDKGYVPVSVKDIAEWYNGNKELPKRCYTLIFDDFRFDNVLDIDNRSVFTRFGVKPALAIISDWFQTTDIYHNGVVISGDKAVEISKMYDFSLVSHTRNHRSNDAVKPSQMLSELENDVYSGELDGINGEYLVFPYGRSNPYMFWAMKWLGYYMGIGVWNNSFSERDTFSRSKYRLVRYEIGMRESLSNVLNGIK